MIAYQSENGLEIAANAKRVLHAVPFVIRHEVVSRGARARMLPLARGVEDIAAGEVKAEVLRELVVDVAVELVAGTDVFIRAGKIVRGVAQHLAAPVEQRVAGELAPVEAQPEV